MFMWKNSCFLTLWKDTSIQGSQVVSVHQSLIVQKLSKKNFHYYKFILTKWICVQKSIDKGDDNSIVSKSDQVPSMYSIKIGLNKICYFHAIEFYAVKTLTVSQDHQATVMVFIKEIKPLERRG